MQPDRVDGYRVTRKITDRLAATVFEGVHEQSGRRVVVKVLKLRTSSDETTQERLFSGAKQANRIHHHGIAALHGFGLLADGTPYLVAEYVPGESLRARLLRKGRLPASAVLRIGRQLAAALEAAHDHNVVHRALRPGNVMLVPDPEVPSGERAKLLDFGTDDLLFACQELDATFKEQTGEFVGNPAYLAPELHQPGDEASDKADVYGLGVLLYEMLAGDPPSLIAESSEPSPARAAKQAQRTPPLAELAGVASNELCQLILSMMSPQPEHRPSMRQVASALAGLDAPSLGAASGSGDAVGGQPRLGRLAAILGSYTGFSLGLLQCVDLIVNRYAFSPELTTLCLYGILLLLPSVLLLGGYYSFGSGVRGRWVLRIGVPINLALLVCILLFSFRGRELGSMTQVSRVTDADGKTISREVPKRAFMKHVAIFFFDNETGDKKQSWLQLGIPDLLRVDLSQDPFLLLFGGSQFAEGLKKAGFDEYSRVPLGLKQELARKEHREYLIAGSFKKEGEAFVIRYSLYLTERGHPKAEHTARGTDLFRLIDEMSMRLRQELDLPVHHIESGADLPVAEIATTSMTALHDFILGTNAWWFHNDQGAAEALLKQAVAEDPQFALAYSRLGNLYHEWNQPEQAKAALRAAKQNEWRMSERARLGMNWKRLFYDKDVDGQGVLLRHWTTVYPEDPEGWLNLSLYHSRQDRMDEAIAALQQMLVLDPNNHNALISLGKYYRLAGNNEKALEVFEQYKTMYPNEGLGYFWIATVLRDQGRFEQAQASYGKVLTVEPGNRFALWCKIEIDIRLGKFELALAEAQRALVQSTTAAERADAHALLNQYYRWRGMLRKAIAEQNLNLEEQRKDASPQELAARGEFDSIEDYLDLGQVAEAEKMLKDAEQRYATDLGPAAIVVRLWRIFFDTRTSNLQNAEQAIKETDARSISYGLTLYHRNVMERQAQLFEKLTQYGDALKLYEELYQKEKTSAHNRHLQIGRCQRQLGRLDEAEASLKQGLALFPSQGELHYELALVYEKRGRTQEAREQVQAALKTWAEADEDYEAAWKARALAARL